MALFASLIQWLPAVASRLVPPPLQRFCCLRRCLSFCLPEYLLGFLVWLGPLGLESSCLHCVKVLNPAGSFVLGSISEVIHHFFLCFYLVPKRHQHGLRFPCFFDARRGWKGEWNLFTSLLMAKIHRSEGIRIGNDGLTEAWRDIPLPWVWYQPRAAFVGGICSLCWGEQVPPWCLRMLPWVGGEGSEASA